MLAKRKRKSLDPSQELMLKWRKMISILDENINEVKEINKGLYRDYQETITYLENILEEYQKVLFISLFYLEVSN